MEINTALFAEEWKEQLKIEIKYLKSVPRLVIMMARDYYAPSSIYVKNKEKVANELGIDIKIMNIEWEDKSKEELTDVIKTIVQDNPGSSFICQLPFPQLSEEEIAELIPANADVDGFTNYQKGLLASGSDKALVPCTALGVMRLLEYIHGDLTGESIAIVSRSNLIGKPLIQLALQKNMTPTVLHTKSKEFDKINSFESSNIIVTGCGRRKLFNSYDVNKEAVKTIVDCSMDKIDGVPGVGDFDKEDILDKCPNINIASGYRHTGLLTVVGLFENVIKAHRQMEIE